MGLYNFFVFRKAVKIYKKTKDKVQVLWYLDGNYLIEGSGEKRDKELLFVLKKVEEKANG